MAGAHFFARGTRGDLFGIHCRQLSRAVRRSALAFELRTFTRKDNISWVACSITRAAGFIGTHVARVRTASEARQQGTVENGLLRERRPRSAQRHRQEPA